MMNDSVILKSIEHMGEEQEIIKKMYEDFVTNILPLLCADLDSSTISQLYAENQVIFNIVVEDILKTSSYKVNVPGKFVHFTSLPVLQSMINEQAIRMYDMSATNDPTEFTHFANLFYKDDDQRLKLLKKATFSFSMCQHDVLNSENALTLWRLYGHDGTGVAIVFEINQAEIGWTHKWTLGKVSYEEMNADDLINAIENYEKKHKSKSVLKGLRKVACIIASHRKNKHYSVEKEVRLVYHDQMLVPAYCLKPGSSKLYDIRGDTSIISYYKLPLGRTDDAGQPDIRIAEVQLGFKHSEENRLKLEDHIRSCYLSLNLDFAPFKKDHSYEYIQAPTVTLSPLRNVYR